MPPTLVSLALTVCGASLVHIVALENREALDELEDYADMTSSDMNALATKMERRTPQQGRAVLPTKVLKNIHALCFWARERIRKGEDLTFGTFDVDALRKAKLEMKLREDTSDKTPTIKPDKFTPAKWRDFSKAFPMYLSGFKGAQYAPLDYIIRPVLTEDDEESLASHNTFTIGIEPRQKDLYNYPVEGRHFTEDNHEVYRLLADLVSGSEGMSWIEEFEMSQNGRAA